MAMATKSTTKYYAVAVGVFITIIIILYSLRTNRRNNFYLKIIDEGSDDNTINLYQYQNVTISSKKLFNLNFKYILNRPCKNDTQALAAFIVTSYFGNIETRSAMRRAFSREDLLNLNIRRVFLLGLGTNDKYTSQKAIENESNRFEDIVQGNFEEAYRNLTYKHVMGLKWANDCSNAKYIIKMDDDIVVDVERIVKLLNEIKFPQNNLLAGYILRGLLPKRDQVNKWFVTSEEYKYSVYPPFVSGWFYITNPATITKLLVMSYYQKYFWIDDVYVTGILAQKLKIRHTDIGKYFAVHSEFLQCCINDVKKNVSCDILIGPNGGDNNMFYNYNSVMKKCVVNKCILRQKPINETCVAERKFNLGKGNAIISSYQLH